ncbi:MAG: ABC transporter ATP-binding protein [Spirochaetia bacterium]|nr:ABC transporter ATP-binding protein [Spirochaetia bacterium]
MVEITNVYAGYGGKPVISIPYLSFKAGEITSIIGRNGSGKSTLLKAIDSLIQYTGSITADGMEIAGLSHKERARTVAYLPQTLIPVRLSIRVLVSHGRYAHTGISHRLSSKDRAMVDNAMELADVYTMQDRWINEISGGEVKRSYLAMVIAQNSRYILLDEPAAGLDISHQIMMMTILRRLAAEGIGVVITSHDTPLSLTYSDKVCMIKDGALLAVQAPSEIEASDAIMRKCIGYGIRTNEDEAALYKYRLEK